MRLFFVIWSGTMRGMKKKEKIVVGMSGGVDSTVSLLLLKEWGYEPLGISLKLPIWEGNKDCYRENPCCSDESLEMARSVCEKAGITHEIVDAKTVFCENVVNYFIDQYNREHTPNPCVICNRHLKYPQLFAVAHSLGIKKVATGHYAQTYNNKTTTELRIPKDRKKDQTYNLSFLIQDQVANIVFPLGNYLKTEVYKIAESYGYKEFYMKHKQSEDFCYVSGKELHAFLETRIGQKRGNITDENGKILGTHTGAYQYTIGQRKGIRLAGGPFYVYDIKDNTIFVTKNEELLSTKKFRITPYNFISDFAPSSSLKVNAKIRYQQSLENALIVPGNNEYHVIFDKPQRAVTKGQLCALYIKNTCIGGGIIDTNA